MIYTYQQLFPLPLSSILLKPPVYKRSMFSSISRRLDGFNESKLSSDIPLFANAVYYPNWRVYGQQPPSSLRLGFVSHVFYAFAWYCISDITV